MATAEYVQKYRDTITEIERQRSDAISGALNNPPGGSAGSIQSRNSHRLIDNLAEARRKVAALELEQADPFAGWMLVHAAPEYPDHVEIVLDALPVTVESLREISKVNCWCPEFDRLLNAAIEAGVLSDGYTTEFYEVIRWVRDTLMQSENRVRTLRDHLERAVRAEGAAAVEKYKKQQEEEEAARKAAQAAARAARRSATTTAGGTGAPEEARALITA